MEIYNVAEHLNCFCYESNEKPLIEVRKINRMESDEISPFSNEIVFVLKGRIFTTLPDNQSTEINNGQFVLLPAGNTHRYKSLSKSVIMIVRLSENIVLCQTYNLSRLSSRIKSVEKPNGYAVLDINARIKHFADGLLETWADGLKCRYYFQAKITELMIMLRAYYSEEQLFGFFYYFFNSDAGFAEFVRTNHLQFHTVNDFAKAMKITSQQFARRFNQVFGETPYSWMQREKARLVYADICRTNKPLKDIAEEYGFTVQANFNRFCKHSFGMSPGEIRKKRT